MVIDDRPQEISHAENLYSVGVGAKLYAKWSIMHPVRQHWHARYYMKTW